MKFLKLGKIEGTKAVTILFYAGLLPLAIAFLMQIYNIIKLLGKILSFSTNSINSAGQPMNPNVGDTNIYDSFANLFKQNTALEASNMILDSLFQAIFLLIALPIIYFVIWKMICELLYKLAEYIESKKTEEKEKEVEL